MKKSELYHLLAKFTESLSRDERDISDTQIAKLTGVSSPRLSQFKASDKTVTIASLAKIFREIATQAEQRITKNGIRPIVEFLPIEPSNRKSDLFDPEKSPKYYKPIRDSLANSTGVYVFYDSRGRVLYVGKTESGYIWNEAKDALYRKRKEAQEIYRVSHPKKNDVTYDIKTKHIKRTDLRLCDIATYFSAYAINKSMIHNIESLLIRVTANDNLNRQMGKFR